MTMQDKLLELLKAQWVTPIDALEKVQCFSLSQRVGNFIDAGHKVQKKWVDLANGKRVKAYTLAGRVEEGSAA
ncbi:helix-turn-helix domain-containing protein [Polaromonas sp. YR568]|uniref:helix-turn-helix domain-containing protein n=1 Tax=Polaromonas sp. YR568 TaxID=1855301 RepID=UPI00313807D0